MTKKKLEKTIQKFLEGRATPEEVAYLEKLEKDAESGLPKELFENGGEKKIRDTVLGRVTENIGFNTSRYPWWKYASAAAVFIGVTAGSYLFMHSLNSKESLQLPADAITLQLEDGRIEVLKEDVSKAVVDKTGKVIGRQKGSQITYEDTNGVEELVYNILTVPYGKRFELKLSDGTQVHLNAGTSLKYPIRFLKGREREVFLTGEAFFGVSKDSLYPFVVKADELDVRVLGTRFNVSSFPEDYRTDVILVEGSVGLNEHSETFDEKKSTLLKPGFKGSFLKQTGEFSMEPVVTDVYTSWMEGELVFRNLTFENILRKLERHYNVSISNNNTDLAKEIFNASYGNVTLIKVLEDLRLTYGIDYTIDQDKIIIN